MHPFKTFPYIQAQYSHRHLCTIRSIHSSIDVQYSPFRPYSSYQHLPEQSVPFIYSSVHECIAEPTVMKLFHLNVIHLFFQVWIQRKHLLVLFFLLLVGNKWFLMGKIILMIIVIEKKHSWLFISFIWSMSVIFVLFIFVEGIVCKCCYNHEGNLKTGQI